MDAPSIGEAHEEDGPLMWKTTEVVFKPRVPASSFKATAFAVFINAIDHRHLHAPPSRPPAETSTVLSDQEVLQQQLESLSLQATAAGVDACNASSSCGTNTADALHSRFVVHGPAFCAMQTANTVKAYTTANQSPQPRKKKQGMDGNVVQPLCMPDPASVPLQVKQLQRQQDVSVQCVPTTSHRAVAFDIETTGLRTATDRIVEVAVVDLPTGR